MRNMVYTASVDDSLTVKTIENIRKNFGIYLDPHSAVAFAAAQKVNADNNWKGNTHTVILSTGHYAKTADIVGRATCQKIPVPESFRSLGKETDPVAIIPPNLDTFEGIIASCV